MEIIPTNFSKEHKQMLSHLYLMIKEGLIAIPEKYEELIISLRTAQAKEFSRLNTNVANTFENAARDNLRDFSREVETHSRRQ